MRGGGAPIRQAMGRGGLTPSMIPQRFGVRVPRDGEQSSLVY